MIPRSGAIILDLCRSMVPKGNPRRMINRDTELRIYTGEIGHRDGQAVCRTGYRVWREWNELVFCMQ